MLSTIRTTGKHAVRIHAFTDTLKEDAWEKITCKICINLSGVDLWVPQMVTHAGCEENDTNTTLHQILLPIL